MDALEQCQYEQDKIREATREGLQPAWDVVMNLEAWEMERRLILEERNA